MMTLRKITAAEMRHQQRERERERENVSEEEKERNLNRQKEREESFPGRDSTLQLRFLALLVIKSY